MIKKIIHSTGYFIFFALILIDASNFFFEKPFFGRAGMIFWYLANLYLVLFALLCLKEIMIHSYKNKLKLTIGLLLLWAVVVILNINSPKNLSGETTQEINCVLKSLSSDGGGYHETCFLGYPARTYYFAALPSLLFGRSLSALNAGAGIYFLVALIIFSGGILKYFNYQKDGDLIAAFILGSLFHSYFLNYLLFYYEQSVFPLVFGLILCGFFYLYLSSKKKFPLYFFGFILFFLIYTYTPALSLYFFALAVIAYFILDKTLNFKHKLFLLSLILLTLFSFYASLQVRKDINLIDQKATPISQLTMDVESGFKHLLLENGGFPFLSPIYSLIFLAILFLSLSFRFGWKYAVGSLWILATIVMSIISKGYSYYGVDFRLQRAVVVFPVFLAFLVFLLKKIDIERLEKEKIFSAFIAFILLSGFFFQQEILKAREPSKHLHFILWLKNNPKFSISGKEGYLYFFPSAYNTSFISLNDELQYFLPELAGRQYLGTGCNLTEKKSFYILKTDDPCINYLSKDTSLTFYGIYSYKDDSLMVFRKE